MLPILQRAGRGFDIAELDVPVVTSVALAKGDLVQLIQTAGGIWSTCTGSGAGTISITAAAFTLVGLTIAKTGAFTNYVYKSGDRFRVTAGTGATAGFYVVTGKTDNNTITIDDTPALAAGNVADLAGSLLDRKLMGGIFGVALTNADANASVMVRVQGNCYAFTKNTADAAIAAGNLYAPTSSKDLDSDAASYGVGAKLVAKAIGTASVSTTATRALRQVTMSGIIGWGGTYGGVG